MVSQQWSHILSICSLNIIHYHCLFPEFLSQNHRGGGLIIPCKSRSRVCYAGCYQIHSLKVINMKVICKNWKSHIWGYTCVILTQCKVLVISVGQVCNSKETDRTSLLAFCQGSNPQPPSPMAKVGMLYTCIYGPACTYLFSLWLGLLMSKKNKCVLLRRLTYEK